MKKKERLSERLEVRLTKKDFNKLKTRAKLHTQGDVSVLVRFWIDNGPIPKKENKDVPND